MRLIRNRNGPPEMSVAMIHAAMHHDQHATSLVAAYRESDLAHANAQRTIIFKYTDGREVSLSLDSNFNPQYKDEYTNERLPHEAKKDACQQIPPPFENVGGPC